jgi:predicted metal-dependent peptidase
VFFIDTSGSISDEDLAKAAAALKGVFSRFPEFEIVVVPCDCQVSEKHVVTIKMGELDRINNVGGGGGTAFQPAFDWVKEHMADEPPLFAVYVTDLYTGDDPEPPPYPVIWACTSSQPDWKWGTTIRL